MTEMRGWFISFEGIDGSGKTTQIKAAADFFRTRGYTVVITREPGGTFLGRRLRKILLEEEGALSEEAELLLYGADRSQHLAEVIRPALNKGAVVLTDRYADSTIAYQGYGRGLDLALIAKINEIASGGLWPDLTFLLDLDVKAAFARIAESRSGGYDRMEEENAAFFRRVREGFLALAEKEPVRFRTVDASRDSRAVFAAIEAQLIRMIGK